MEDILKWTGPTQRTRLQIANADHDITCAILAIQAEVEKMERATEILRAAYPDAATELASFAKAIDREAGKAMDTAVGLWQTQSWEAVKTTAANFCNRVAHSIFRL